MAMVARTIVGCGCLEEIESCRCGASEERELVVQKRDRVVVVLVQGVEKEGEGEGDG